MRIHREGLHPPGPLAERPPQLALMTGKITLKDASKGAKNEQVIQMGEKVVFKVNAYIDDFVNDTKVINANATVINLTDDTQRLIYTFEC